MKRLTLLIAGLFILAGCGGGGGGTSGGGGGASEVDGFVLDVQTGGATNPQSTVSIGSNSAKTDAGDGSFQVAAATGATTVAVATGSSYGNWTFTIPPVNGTVSVGALWVGPTQVQVKGRLLSSTNGNPVPGATISFAGRQGLTAADGTFTLNQVAYSSTSQAAFWGIEGTAHATGFFDSTFSAQPNVAVGGVVTVNDILITPSSDINPPPPPFNIWGKVSPANAAPGTVATLKENGTPVRIFNVGSDTNYYFWIQPGTYTIDFVKGALHATTSVTLTQTNQVIRKDVTLQ